MKKPNKDLHISFRVSPEQKMLIEEKAEQAYLSVSDFVRAAALGREVNIIADGRELARQLAAVGNNLNQIAALAHAGKIQAAYLSEALEVLKQIEEHFFDAALRVGVSKRRR